MSDTPRTDAETRQVWSSGNYGMGDDYAEEVVDAKFAQRLERELAAYKQAALTREQYDKSHMTLAAENHNLRLDVETLRKALLPLASIAAKWAHDELDESRPSWGHTREFAAEAILVSSRGGATLLILNDAFRAQSVLNDTLANQETAS